MNKSSVSMGTGSRELIHRTAIGENTRASHFVLSDDTIDRMGDVMHAAGAQLKAFKDNPIALFNHNPMMIVGTWKDIRVQGKRLVAKFEPAEEDTSTLVNEIRKLIAQGILKAVSVGFLPLKLAPNKDTGGYVIQEWELLEASLVSVPANPSALAISKRLQISETTQRLVFGDSAIVTSGGPLRKTLGDSALKPRIDQLRSRMKAWS